ncbi:MAG TPA: hypothetical protein PLV92_26450, partial [Pirellulaceae bacterium]|nr:hypothetical protein [Pirellulaceae bacterium]
TLDGLPPNVSSIVDSTLESSWALAGVRSLPFDFAAIANDTSVNVVTFRSLGQEPRLEIAVVDQRRLDAISWCIVFAIAASGVVGLRRSVGYRFTLVIVGMVVVTVLPIVAPWHQEVSLLADRALVMFAVVALVYVSLAIGVWADGVRLQLVERARQRRAAAQAEAARRMAEQQALEEQRAREGQAQATDPPSSNASPSATSPASSSNASYSSVPAAEAQPADQRPADEKTGNASSEAMSSNGMNAAEAKSAASSVGDVNSPNAATASSQPSAASSGPVQNPSAQSKPSQTPPTSSGGKGKNHGKGKGGGGGKGPRFHLLLIFALLSLTGLADAQEPNTGVGEDKGKPVVVPADAIIVPFNPDVPTGAQMADKVFVPYDKYVALWNLAHPDRPLGVAKLPANFAWNGATYDA